ncbi:MAG: pyridoxal-phosphate dependent enzyme [Bacteroidetes bacterium]|nr:pyridoxal-phosphate dependent enzyme [Bacteroidota bacterium]
MIELIEKVVHPEIREKAVQRFREKGIILPTFAQMRNPELIPGKMKDELRLTGLWELNPVNLFRISWKNEPVERGGLFGGVNFIEIPSSLSGVKARIIVLTGKWFPTGAHKVGAAYGCLAPRIITGGFDPEYHKAVWPSTGNYCRGGAFDSYLMGCTAVAILPEEMSRERFEWLREIGAEVIATPGCESNVKEIYDKCWDIRRNRPDCIIFNQFDEFGNPAWHYNVTGPAVQEVFESLGNTGNRLAGFVSSTGSAGTIAAGDYLKTLHPAMKIVASEALQCPTLLSNGFGGHRIEGIGDKHVPWVHNVRNTDAVAAIDDEDCMRAFRLFNEPAGKKLLHLKGLDLPEINKLNVLGISGIANVLAAIKTARYFELDQQDILVTIATDSSGMYQSRLEELQAQQGEYTEMTAAGDYERCLPGQRTDHFKELSYQNKKAIHNLKYFTWVEQQGKLTENLNQLWYDHTIWNKLFHQVERWDELIMEFNDMTGLLK